MALGSPLPLHGGDLAAAEARWGQPSLPWLDLSTGLNPWPYPVPALPPEAWARLPGRQEEDALRRAAARRYGAPGPDTVVAAPGTQALIQALPRLVEPGRRVAVLGPTYGEHAAAWAAAGHRVDVVSDLAALAEAQVAVVVNPNNPDGRAVEPARLLDLAGRLELLVADEAFADVRPELSVAGSGADGLVVLRSFGKFYGLAGLRLGFAIARPATRDALAAMLGPWAVCGPALAVGRAALEDDGWAAATSTRLTEWSARLDAVLAEAGLRVVGGTSLFRLAEHGTAREAYERLGRAGILVRAFADRPQLLRFGLPADEAGLTRLRLALAP